MLGDKIVIKPHHTRAAQGVYEKIREEVLNFSRRAVITVAGESGCGKSEISSEIARVFKEKENTESVIFHQDDYFVYPPKTNGRMRRQANSRVGMGEVKLDLLDSHIHEAKKSEVEKIEKPLIDYDKDKVISEIFDLKGVKILFAEGTYTTALKNIDIRIFIDRTYLDTLQHRKERARDNLEDFSEGVLEIEHRIISSHKKDADVIIDEDYEV